MMTNEALTDELEQILMDVLGVDREELEPTARFFEDLGGESIDVLELSFRCEKQFGVKMQFETMVAGGEQDIDADGSARPEFVQRLQMTYPFLDASALPPRPGIMDLRQLLTVAAIIGYVKAVLSATEAGRAARCGRGGAMDSG